MTTMNRAANAPPAVDLAPHLPELHSALEQQRQFRLEQLRELAEAATRSSTAVADVHDEIGEILRTSAMTALTEVEAALDRLRAGSYGHCERCTTRIPFERLEILPMLRFCMHCQRDLDRG
jgi:DnaK suppressor protein